MDTMSNFLKRDLPTVRVATWNIDGRLDDRDSRLEVIIETLKNVLCMQECWFGAERKIATALGFFDYCLYTLDNQSKTGNAILSKLPIIGRGQYDELPNPGENAQPSALTSMTVTAKSGREWRFSSAHLAWGSRSEGSRLSQAQEIERLAAKTEEEFGSELVQVLCGDLNALPSPATLRYITGLDPDKNGTSTSWVDAWATRESAPGYTSSMDNPMMATIARRVGILEPSFLPNRRIDYILTRGFAYGRPGNPISVKLLDRPVDGKYGSDHYGIVANLWDPAV